MIINGVAMSKKCPECNGKGEVPCPRDYDGKHPYSCPICGGDPKVRVPCPACEGTGKYEGELSS